MLFLLRSFSPLRYSWSTPTGTTARHRASISHADWRPGYPIDSSGLYYINAFDYPNFNLTKSEGCKLGWDKSVALLASRATHLVTVMDSITGIPLPTYSKH